MTAAHERPRVVLPKDWSFDLAEELVDRIKGEFDPREAVDELAPKVEGQPFDQANAIAERHFEDYGRRWMDRTLELGNLYRDRTYETLLAAAEKTEDLAFPFLPERFIEIAYLSTQPIYSLPIVENTRRAFSYKMVFCDTIAAMRERFGDELANALPCRRACLTAAERAFTAHGFDVEVTQTSSLASQDFCQFNVRRQEA